MQLIDEVKVNIQSGKGGNGCISFRREKYIPYGGPNGGDGGKGGDVIISSDPNINTLAHFRFKHHFKAQNGQHGMGSNKSGKAGEDVILKVPFGTQIFSDDGEIMIYDFGNHQSDFVLAKGGKGGIGNTHFKSSTNRAPQFAIDGEAATEMWLWIKLKMLSDVGIIGLPNAGKSTLLSKTSNARPKIADYPFTTLSPQLGIIRTHDREFVMADIPGLIEGASLGVGLGIKFLKHIERCKVLLHLIDINSEDIINDYKKIRTELQNYSEELVKKVEVICLSKADSLDIEVATQRAQELSKAIDKEIYIISAVSGYNIEFILDKLFGMFPNSLGLADLQHNENNELPEQYNK
jgi:GTP-binding protein